MIFTLFNSYNIIIPFILGQIYIPCSYQPCIEGSKYLLIYFHGNAEDIGYAAEFTRKLTVGLKV